MPELDQQTQTLVRQLYEAWSTNADPTSYLHLRDDLLGQRERVDTCIATLKAVVSVACPQIVATDRYVDAKWEELFALAESIESSTSAAEEAECSSPGKRKRSYNEVSRLRNLAVVSALWSPAVVCHYGWEDAAQGSLRLLKACALQYPHFAQIFCPRLNRVLLDRHREALVSAHVKTLNEAPLQLHRDLKILAAGGVVPDLEAEESWVTSVDGAVPVDASGRLLKDLRPLHVSRHLLCRDQYGMLVPRGEGQEEMVASSARLDFSIASSIYEQFLAQDDYLFPPDSGLTISPADLFTPSSVDFLLDGLASSYQSEPSSARPTEASTMTSVSDDEADVAMDPDRGPAADDFLTADVSGQFEAEDETVNAMRGGFGRRKDSRRTSIGENTARISKPSNASRPRVRPAGGSSVRRQEKLTLEEDLQNRYSQMLSTYSHQLRNEIIPGNEQRKMRSQWLTPDLTWARIFSIPGSSDLLPGSAYSQAESDILYCSAEAFVAAAQAGEVFQKPVVIKESFSDAGMHTYERFLSLLDDASTSDELVDVRCIDIKHPMHEGLTKFTTYLRSRSVPQGETDGLWMSTARSVAKCHRPLFTMLNRFRLLESLSEGLHDLSPDSAPTLLLKAMSTSLNTVAFSGAFSGAYLNTLAGCWQRNLSGIRLWVFVPEAAMPLDELADAARDVSNWMPQGKQRLVVLEENDVLFVPPGLRIVQAWHAPTTCLTEQGMLWDDLSILSVVETMTWRQEHQSVRDERVSRQLPRMIPNLGRLIHEQPDRFRRDMEQKEFVCRFREAVRPWLAS